MPRITAGAFLLFFAFCAFAPQSASAESIRITTRTEWGADETLLFEGKATARTDVQKEKAENGNIEVSQREKDCAEWHRLHPNDFRVNRTVESDLSGKKFRWPQQFSPEVRLIVVHHTALEIVGDTRTPIERMRALYEYHAGSLGWGDIGYHYVVDETGRIYEGKAGGKGVVGGHVYCGNVGTLGIALMGNLEVEKPAQQQVIALQKLLAHLSRVYQIDLTKSVTYHGKSTNPVALHKDLIATECPGFYLSASIAQVRRNVLTGNLDAEVLFPTLVRQGYTDRTRERRLSRIATGKGPITAPPSLRTLGETTISGRPGGEIRFDLEYTAGSAAAPSRARIAEVTRSSPRIGIWQDIQGRDIRVRDELILPEKVSASGSTRIRLRVQLPSDLGQHTMTIGDQIFILVVEGRRTRAAQTPNPSISQAPTIRIRLSHPLPTATLSSESGLAIDGERIPGDVRLGKDEDRCTALVTGMRMESALKVAPVLRIHSEGDHAAVSGLGSYRGTIECRIIDGSLALINELPLEDYMRGLSEEPDAEPFEKQKAIAIAARSYAAFYMDREHRKFPGMPYDGDDSAERFQKYSGAAFEVRNPSWTRAVRETAGQVIMKGGAIVKAAYFSSSDGRTRSPEELGWKNFPFAEVFVSKPDPWCDGLPLAGHGVGMSGCGAAAQAREGKTAEEILQYYYPGAIIDTVKDS